VTRPPDATPGSPASDEEGRTPTAPDRATGSRWRRRARREAGRALELSALTGLAVASPVLSPFGQAPDVFVGIGADGVDVVVFGLIVALVPVIALVAGAALTRLAGPSARSWTQTGLVAVLAGFYATDLARSGGGSSGVRVAVAAATVVGVAWLHRNRRALRWGLRYAAPSPLLFLAVFLVLSSTASLVRPAPSEPAGAAPAPDGRPSVVVIVLDELPTLSLVDGAGGIDRDLFPNLARLADTSNWYRNATTVAPVTSVAVPALLTGQLPEEAQTYGAAYADHPDNLFTLLAPTHELHVLEWVTELCPSSFCPEPTGEITDEAASLLRAPPAARPNPVPTLLGEAADIWWSRVWPTAEITRPQQAVLGQEEGNELARSGLEFLSGLEPADGPVLDFLHAPVPHMPWRLLPSGNAYDGPHPARGAEFLGWDEARYSEHPAEVARARHLLQLQWVDRLLGAVFDRLEELGRWDESLVVLTADHGVTFTPGLPLRELWQENQVEMAWVPLLVKEPGQRTGAVIDDNVLLLDVLPTIAELLGLEVPWEVDGTSFAGGSTRAPDDKPALTPQPDRWAVADGQRIDLDPVGLDELTSAPAHGGGDDPTDPLRLYRIGRHGHLVGRSVDELGVCGEGPTVAVTGHLPGDPDIEHGHLPVWVDGEVRAPGARDVAVAVDGVVAGWDRTLPTGETGDLGVLLAEPLVVPDPGDTAFYEIVEGDGCRLAHLSVER
jgi:hypothetical protein